MSKWLSIEEFKGVFYSSFHQNLLKQQQQQSTQKKALLYITTTEAAHLLCIYDKETFNSAACFAIAYSHFSIHYRIVAVAGYGVVYYAFFSTLILFRRQTARRFFLPL